MNLKEAVEIITQDKTHYATPERKEAHEIILKAADLLLNAGKVFPPLKEGIKFHSGRQNSELSAYSPTDNRKVGYNIARSEDIAILAKKCMGMGEMIHRTREWQALHIEVEADILESVKKGLALAITQHLKGTI